MDKTFRECAIEHLKQGNLCKGYIDYKTVQRGNR